MPVTQSFSYQPLISIIVPVFNPPERYLRAALESVLNQTYRHWELCLADDASTQPYIKPILEEYAQTDPRIKVVFRTENGHISRASNSAIEIATGEYIGLLDHDDLLTPDALEEVVKLLNQHPEADMIYSDENKIDDYNNFREPTYKPDWCPDTFLTRMYTCHFGVYRRSMINQIGGFRAGFEGSQDYDLVLRLTEQTKQIFHIPKILYHWRFHSESASAGSTAKPYAYEAALKAIQEALNRRGEGGTVAHQPGFQGRYRVRYPIHQPQRVSIIILNRDSGHILNQCLTSIFTKTQYPNYEVIVIDNGSTETEAQRFLKFWKQQKHQQFNYKLIDFPFNYSQLNNYGATQATGEYFVFLNNDTQIITPDWLNALIEQVQRPSIGAVGGLLLYPDRALQHAGFALDPDKIIHPIYQGLQQIQDSDTYSQVILTNNISAVSGACLACRREVFQQVGGFEENLPLFYGDVDLCLKMMAQGYQNIYLPHVRLYHQALASWNVELTQQKRNKIQQFATQWMQQKWSKILEQDPCFNPYWLQKFSLSFADNAPLTTVSLKTSDPLVSICIPTYNGEKYIKEALESVLSQTYSNLEVIISDDNSSDNTLAICRSFIPNFSGNFHIFSHAQYGLAVNWNYAISQAQGKYIKLLFQDDILKADCIRQLVNLAEQDEEIGLVFSKRSILMAEEAKSNKICHGIHASATEIEKTRSNLKPIQEGRELLSDLHLLNPPLNKIGEPSTVLIKKSVFEQLGYFDPELKQLLDVEMWLRIMDHYKIGFIDQNLSDWRIHPQQLTVSNWLTGETRQDLEKFYQKICQSSYLSKLHPQVKAWIQNPTQAQIWIKWLMGEVLSQSQLQIFTEIVSNEQINAPDSFKVSSLNLISLRQPEFKVSALISTDKAETMLSGRLENLVNQTLFKKGQLEIIVIDSGSPEQEREIVLAFKEQYPDSIVYLRTEERETIYAAWNRGIAIARGQYITNQNTDDRLKSTALERLATYLDDHENVALVHGEQQAIPNGEIVDLEQLNGKPHWQWSGFSPLKLLFLAQVGSQPMWRKSLHDQYGLFDETLKVRGDQDFYIRIANAGEFHFIPEILGTLNLSEQSLSHQQDLSRQEEIIIFNKYTASREKLAKFFNQKQLELTDQNYQILVNNFCCDLANQVLPQFHLPFYLKLVTDLLNSVAELGIYQQIVQTNALRIWNRFADPSTRFQFMKTLSPLVIEACDDRIQIKGEAMEKINESEIEKQKITIVTSIAPGNVEKQKAAIASWKQLGFAVVSLNSASEIAQLQPQYQNVTFQNVNRDAQAEVGKPLIYLDDIFRYFQDHPCKLCGIVNSDIQLQADENLSVWLLDQAENAMIFGSRIEIETLEKRQGEPYNKGFDFFFFDPKFLKDFPASNFCLGLPWWDFWVPLIAGQRGWTLKRLESAIAYHLKHSVNYANDNWQKYGIEFTKFFNPQLSEALQQLKLKNPNQLQGQLIQIANQFLEQIHQKSISIQYQNLSNLSIKTMDIQARSVQEQATLTCLSQSQWTFPPIRSIDNNPNRPFWSVMIPTFNKVKYLEQTLRSVLEQAPGEDEMQIEVINDCPDSTVQAELEAIVKKVGGDRIKFYRHSQQNIGQSAIFNLCLERAQGHWIHLLHDDDFVLPGFYQSLRNTINKEANIGAIFCRHYYVDGENKQRSVSVLERETAGILEHWLERIAVSQRIQPSSIVVKRTTYEQLGGFCPEAKSAADWEMWTRISAHYLIGYEPQILAAYRLHLSSWTSRLIETGGNIADTRQSIEIAQSYLPQNQAVELSNKAKEHYAFYALNTAQQMLIQGKATAVIAQIQEALNCSQSNAVKEAIIQLFSPQQPQLKTLTPAQILAETSRLVGEYRQQPNSDSIVTELRRIRQIVAQYWLGLEAEKLEKIYSEDIGKAHQILLNSGIKNEVLTPQEQEKIKEWKTYLDEGWHQPKTLQHLLALMLYCYPYQLPAGWYIQSPIPKWFVTDYFKYMLAVPQYFQTVGEADHYYRYLQNWLDYTTGRFFSEPNFKLWQELAWLFTQTANFIPLYFNTANLKHIYIKRAEIMAFALKSLGHQLDYQFSNRPANRSRIRLGILSNHFSPQTETYSTLPVFEHLDRTQFEVILYAVQSNNHPLEQYCRSRVDQFIKLPKNLPDQVQLIRNDDLDILLIGSNVTAVTHSVTLLALHRLARIQVASTSSCVTTGMPTIDCYISGTLTESQQNAQEQYREKLVQIEGTAHCFSYYSIPPEPPKSIPNRASLGISEDTVVFISGANFYKIIPEVRETWAKILAAVPNSVLVLYPFNPNWTSQYAGIPFIQQFQSTFAQSGIESHRLIFLQPQPSRADIKEYLKLADVYLDSYPFSGVNSLVDPLEVNLVPIVQDGESIPSHSAYSSQSGQLFIVGDGGCFRSLMGASLLRSLSIPDLIANSEEAYINLAVTLAKNPQLRQQKRQEIQQKMQQNPEFLESRTYSAKMGQVFQNLFHAWLQEHQSWQLDSRETLQQYLSKLVTAINAYDLDRNNQLVISELRKIRQVLTDFWLKLPADQLEKMYQSDLGKGYQILLNRGIQREPLIETEQQFLANLTQQAIGLKQENSLNCLMVCMLYYPPGRMLVQDAENRLPNWLIKDYKHVFESPTILEKVQPLREVASASTLVKNLTPLTTEAFRNQLLGCVSLYRIDPTNSSVVEELRQLRQQMAEFWLTVDASELASVYQSLVQPYQAFLKLGFYQQSLTESEQQFFNNLVNQMSQKLETPELMNFLLATLLYCRPGQIKITDMSRLPEWFREDYLKMNS